MVWNMNFIFPYIGKNNPNWLSYFSEGWVYHQPYIYIPYGNIYHQCIPNVSIYTIHGSYGYNIYIYTYLHIPSIFIGFSWFFFSNLKASPKTTFNRRRHGAAPRLWSLLGGDPDGGAMIFDGKPPFLMGKSTISTGPFSIAILNNQRVYRYIYIYYSYILHSVYIYIYVVS